LNEHDLPPKITNPTEFEFWWQFSPPNILGPNNRDFSSIFFVHYGIKVLNPGTKKPPIVVVLQKNLKILF